MYLVEKTFALPIGHRLSKHAGKCYSIHGHNFTVKVAVKSEYLNVNDMVIDFSDLKKIVNEILDPLDHCLVLNKNDSEVINMDPKFRVMFVDHDPTAERLAEYLYYQIKNKLPVNVFIDEITVFENETSKATYSQK